MQRWFKKLSFQTSLGKGALCNTRPSSGNISRCHLLSHQAGLVSVMRTKYPMMRLSSGDTIADLGPRTHTCSLN